MFDIWFELNDILVVDAYLYKLVFALNYLLLTASTVRYEISVFFVVDM